MSYPLRTEPYTPMPSDQEPDNDNTTLSTAPGALAQPISTAGSKTRKPLWPPEHPLQALMGSVIVALLGAVLAFGVSQTARLDHRIDRLEDKMDARFAEVDERFDELEAKFEARFEKIDERFEKVDARIDELETKFDAKFDELDAKIDELDAKIDDLRLQLTTLIAVLNTTNQVEDAIEGNVIIPDEAQPADAPTN